MGNGRGGAGTSSNLEHSGDVRVRPESRLREMETLIKTRQMDDEKRMEITEPKKSSKKSNDHPSCTQRKQQLKRAPRQTCGVRGGQQEVTVSSTRWQSLSTVWEFRLHRIHTHIITN